MSLFGKEFELIRRECELIRRLFELIRQVSLFGKSDELIQRSDAICVPGHLLNTLTPELIRRSAVFALKKRRPFANYRILRADRAIRIQAEITAML